MSNKNKKREGIVYSTNPEYEYKKEEIEEPETLPITMQKLYVRKEIRNGKPNIIIKDFIGKTEDLRELEKLIKNHCGTGGSSKDGDIIIQGDNKEKIILFLQKLGYKTKG